MRPIRTCLLGLMVLLTTTVHAQMTVNLRQLSSFVESSIKLKQDDRKVADYIKKMKLTEQLDDETIENWQSKGLGYKSVTALRELAETTKKLPKAAAPPPEPKPVVIPPPPQAEQQRVLEEVRKYAMGYSRRLPDFICMQVTRRYADPSGLEMWHPQDTINEKLTYFEQKEKYEVVSINGRFTDISHDRLGGASSSGEFGSMMKEIFDPESETKFEWQRWGTLKGRRQHVFAYNVSQARSKWTIDYRKSMRIIPAYRGLIYADADYLTVTRITLEAINIPPDFPVQQATEMLDYEFTKIGETEHVLPLRAEVRMREGRHLTKNVVEFRLYRKFGAEATIKFDVPDALPEEKENPPAAAPAKKK
ncbi:MAG: hypothetical protein HY820_34750 [Acidobacteria bacterium]|nr:hypothetical protein [Acidobacteriota bacterium]